jgi:hypothetical protein
MPDSILEVRSETNIKLWRCGLHFISCCTKQQQQQQTLVFNCENGQCRPNFSQLLYLVWLLKQV